METWNAMVSLSSSSSSSSFSSSSSPLNYFSSSRVAIANKTLCSKASLFLHGQPLNAPPFLCTSSGTRVLSILLPSPSRPLFTPRAIHSSDPDFYKIPYVEGIPVGKKLKLFNLPSQCKKSELLEWFEGVKVRVESLELTSPENRDPKMQGISGFVEFETKQDACIAIVRLDGAKFRGHYVRMDFAEKRPHSKDYGSRRNRPNNSGRSRPTMNTSASTSPSSTTFPGTIGPTNNTQNYNATSSASGTSDLSSSYNANSATGAPVSDSTSSYVASYDRASSSSSGNNIGYNNNSTLGKQGQSFGNAMIKRINDKEINAYDLSYSVAQNQRFEGELAEESLENRRIPEGNYKNDLDAIDGSYVNQIDSQTSYTYGPMYGSPQPSSPYRIFVGNMDLSIDDASLQQVFSKYGTVLEARVLKENGQSRGIAVVTMSSLYEIKEASRGLDGRLVGSKYMRVASAS